MSRFFLTYANNSAAPMASLGEELNAIEALFKNKNRRPEVILNSYANRETISSSFTEICKTVEFFSYSGHVQNEHFVTEADEFVSIKGIATYLKTCPNIKLVLLNGCGTKQHLEELKAVGVKVIIYTQAEVHDDLAKEFAVAFFASFLEGNALKDAFLHAQGKVTLPPEERKIEFKIRRGLELEDVKEDEWGIYVESDVYAQCCLDNWYVERESLFGKPEYSEKFKVFFLGDKDVQVIYDHIEHFYASGNQKIKWQNIWASDEHISDEAIAAEIAKADAVFLCVNGLKFFRDVWNKVPKVQEVIRALKMPIFYLHNSFDLNDKQLITDALISCECFEFFESPLPITLIEAFNTPHFLSLLKGTIKQKIDQVVENLIHKNVHPINLQKELKNFDLDKPIRAFKNTIRKDHQFYLFCVEGSEYSGQDILLNRMKKNMPDPNIEARPVYFSGKSVDIMDEQSLWEKLRSEFKIVSTRDIPFSLVDKLLEAPKFLIFDNVITEEMDVETAKSNMALVAHFWQKISSYLDEVQLNPDQKIYVIAVNRGYSPQKQFALAGFTKNHPKAIVEILPTIEPIDLTYAQDWYSDNWDKFTPSENGPIHVQWDTVVGEGHFDKVLMRLCNELGCRAEIYTNLVNNTNLQQ